MSVPLLQAEGVAKAFGGVPALRDGRLTLEPGTVHALCGGNGAGKSTLLNIIMGLLRRDAGTIRIKGQPVDFASPAQALDHGLSIITQELSPIRGMTVAENIFLHREPRRAGFVVNYRRLNEQAAALLDRLRFPVDPRARMSELSLAQTQLVEIAKANILLRKVIGPSYKPASSIWKQYASGMPWNDGQDKVYNVPWTPITLENADTLLKDRQK